MSASFDKRLTEILQRLKDKVASSKSKKTKPDPPEWWEEDAVREEIREELEKTLRPKIKTEVRKAVEDETRAKVWKELHDAFESRLPTSAQKDATRRSLTNMETDCLIRAQTCSEYADKEDEQKVHNSEFYGWTGFLVACAMVPSWVLAHMNNSWLMFFSLTGPALITLITSLALRDMSGTRHGKRSASLRNVVSKYETLAEDIRVFCDTKLGAVPSQSDLTDRIRDFSNSKARLDGGEDSKLSIKDARRVRVAVTEQQITDLSVDDLVRVDVAPEGLESETSELNCSPIAK